ncbi:MAG: AraC family transcriptional regulator [Oscillospiraceae bacterium]|nr:AraC family transcriptional regulator [Oscillospiraceae bacterium]
MDIPIVLRDDRSEAVPHDFSDFPVYIRRGWLSQHPNYSAVSHWHDDIELIAVLSGDMSYYVGGTVIYLKEGDGVFINSRQLHYGFSQNRSECEYLCVLAHPLLLCSSPLIEREFVAPPAGGRGSALLSPAEGDPLGKRHSPGDKKDPPLPRHLFRRPSDPDLPARHLEGPVRIRRPKPFRPEGGQRLSSLRDMVGYVQKHYQEKISLQDIAAAGGVSQSTCCNIFRRQLHQSPISFVTEYRLKKSIELICSSDLTITEISYEVGFSGASYFAETFRRHFGCAPTEYRSHRRDPQGVVSLREY